MDVLMVLTPDKLSLARFDSTELCDNSGDLVAISSVLHYPNDYNRTPRMQSQTIPDGAVAYG